MAAQRLNAEAIDLIVTTVVKRSIDKQVEALQEERYDLCHAIYDERIGKPYGALLAQLPEGLLHSRSDTHWEVVGRDANASSISLSFRESLPGVDYYQTSGDSSPTHKNRFALVSLTQAGRLEELDHKIRTLRQSEDSETSKARMAIRAHKTFEALEAAWPEVFDLVPGLKDLRMKRLPALIADMTSLREMAIVAGLKAAA